MILGKHQYCISVFVNGYQQETTPSDQRNFDLNTSVLELESASLIQMQKVEHVATMELLKFKLEAAQKEHDANMELLKLQKQLVEIQFAETQLYKQKKDSSSELLDNKNIWCSIL